MPLRDDATAGASALVARAAPLLPRRQREVAAATLAIWAERPAPGWTEPEWRAAAAMTCEWAASHAPAMAPALEAEADRLREDRDVTAAACVLGAEAGLAVPGAGRALSLRISSDAPAYAAGSVLVPVRAPSDIRVAAVRWALDAYEAGWMGDCDVETTVAAPDGGRRDISAAFAQAGWDGVASLIVLDGRIARQVRKRNPVSPEAAAAMDAEFREWLAATAGKRQEAALARAGADRRSRVQAARRRERADLERRIVEAVDRLDAF